MPTSKWLEYAANFPLKSIYASKRKCNIWNNLPKKMIYNILLWRDKGETDTGWLNREEERRGVWRRKYEEDWLTLSVVRDQLQQNYHLQG